MNRVSQTTLFSNSTIGARHLLQQMTNQDSCQTAAGPDYQIFAVADGHGATECFRSEIGSRLAVDVAIKNLELFAQTIKKYDLYSYLSRPKERDELIRSLISDIVAQWNQYVYADIKAYPIKEEEYERSQTLSSIYQKGMYLTNIYGSTMIAGLVTPEYIVLFQQGDGTLVVLEEDGTIDDPMPEDDLCIRNLTTSLCDKDAAKRMRYVYMDRKEKDPIAMIAATDGVERSFGDNIHLSAFYAELFYELSELDEEQVGAYLANLLPQISQRGSQDDVTMAGFFDAGRIGPIGEVLVKTVRTARSMDTMKSAESTLKQEITSKNHYIRESEKLHHELMDIENEMKALEKHRQDIIREIDQIQKKHMSTLIACKEAKNVYDKANCMFIQSLIALEEHK
jgi:hypothetical protein